MSTPEALEASCVNDWPGCVRELASVIQRLSAFSGGIILREDLLSHINLAERRKLAGIKPESPPASERQ